jgi:hypothetical protein
LTHRQPVPEVAAVIDKMLDVEVVTDEAEFGRTPSFRTIRAQENLLVFRKA